MKPLNTKERNSTFWSFALFFMLTLGLIMTVISLSFEIPHRQLAQLNIKVKAYNDVIKTQNDIFNQIDSINSFFQQYDQPSANPAYFQKTIRNSILALENAVGDENESNGLYHKIIENHKKLLNQKSKLLESSNQLNITKGLWNECQEDNKKALKDLQDKDK